MLPEQSALDVEGHPSNPLFSSESLAEATLCRAVSSRRAAFCCGGRIPIANDGEQPFENISVHQRPSTSPPVIVRWDRPGGQTIHKLTLPSVRGADKATPGVEELVEHCSPATFGHKGEEVLDESYRKAVKLDSCQFSTNFNPHDVGIISAVTQVLLPQIAVPQSDGDAIIFSEHLGIVAELYKLNVR